MFLEPGSNRRCWRQVTSALPQLVSRYTSP